MKISSRRKIGILFLTSVMGILAFQNCSPSPESGNLAVDSEQEQNIDVPQTVNYPEGGHVILGDMAMPTKVFSDLSSARTTNNAGAFGNLPSTLKPWSGGLVSIVVPKKILIAQNRTNSNGDQALTLVQQRLATEQEYDEIRAGIFRACLTISQVANVRCEISDTPPSAEVSNTLYAFLLSDDDELWCGRKGNSCARIGGPSTTSATGVQLDRPWMAMRFAHKSDPGVYLHEFGHVLGLLHEHQRSDAGEYLLVSPALGATERANYFRFPGFNGIIPDLNFDFGSMMMYPTVGEMSTKFVDGSVSLAVRKEFYSAAKRQIEWRGMASNLARPSVQDVLTLQRVYGPPAQMAGKASCSLGSRVIPHGSFIAVYGAETILPNGFSSCTSSVRNCDDGVLSGAGDKLSCDVSCADGPAKVAYGYSQTFFERSTVPTGQQCRSQVRQCSAQGLSVPAGQLGFTASSCAVQGQVPPTPTPAPVTCAAGTDSFTSVANNVGAVATCNARWLVSSPSAARINSTVTNGGSHSAICSSTGAWTSVQRFCPPLANQVTPTPTPTPPPTITPTPTPTPPPTVTSCAAGNEVRWVIQDISGLKNRNANQPPASFCRGLTSSQPTRAMSYPVQTTTTVGFMVSGAAQAVCNANGTWSVTDAQGASCGVDNIGAASAAGKRFTLRLNLNAANPSLLVVGVRSIWRSRNAATGDHLMSLNGAEGLNVGYSDEGVGFYTAYLPGDDGLPSVITPPSTPTGLVRLYRCTNPSTTLHSVRTVSCAAHGEVHEGHYGYIFNSASTAALYGHPTVTPLYNCKTGNKVLTTPSSTECALFDTQEILGYMPSGY